MTAAEELLMWIEKERAEYADSTDHRQALIDELRLDPHFDGQWSVLVTNYLRRAQLLGLDSMAGRQAMGKLIVSCMHVLETAVDVFGPMPVAGVPSGEVVCP
ncbi:MAG TPA: hypothetical protein VNT52_17295 [Acidimicrobiales bacterium]|jgi:hypothetical protein|nr:hypothetical protein [Acidimicrobiales bacterium]